MSSKKVKSDTTEVKAKKVETKIETPPRGAYSIPRGLKRRLSLMATAEGLSKGREREIRLLMIEAHRHAKAVRERKLREKDNSSGESDE